MSLSFWRNKCSSNRMRRRYDFSVDEDPNDDNLSLDGPRPTKSSIHSVPFYIGLILLLLLLGVYGTVYLIDGILPTPLTLEDEKDFPNAFITDRAHHDLRVLTELGPRIAGGHENEYLAVNFLKAQINTIIQKANVNQLIEQDLQVVSGSHYLNKTPFGNIVAYSNLQNVVVKLYSRNNSDTSLLVNAHFDSVPTSPGGSDDGINCAVMLEVLRKMSKLPERPEHNVIFLFNGAEEPGLQASHGFITQHKWAKEVKVVVNLEATGHGGKIILFQTGPNAPWLSKYYNQVPHPYGQAAGEEIFQTNLIPSDTDFRIFRDYGGMVGLDMAFFKNGYKYHTKYDDFEHIPKGSYQHVGDNTLSLVKSLANAPELYNAGSGYSKIVYFDFIGLFMISYTQLVGNVMNYIVVAFSLGLSLISLHNFKLGYNKQIAVYLALTFGAILGGWVLAGLFITATAFLLDSVGYSMSWYGNPWMIFGLFCAPTAAILPILLPLVQKENITISVKSQIQAHASRLVWTLILFIGTVLNIRTTYAILIPVMFNTLAFLIIYVFRFQHSIRKWQIIYVVFNIVPATFLMYTALTTVSLFVPLSGRIGSDKNADLLIGMMALLFTILVISPFMALASLMRDLKYYFAVLGAIFLVFLIIVFTPLGFPYSGNPYNPTPQRYWIIHTRRVFHAENKTEIKRDAGFFLLNMDRNSPSKVAPFVKMVNKAKSIEEDCGRYLYCGLPLVHPKMIEVIKYSTWIPASQPVVPDPTNFEVLSKTRVNATLLRYNVSIVGPARIGIYFSPKAGLKITEISLIPRMPADENTAKINGRPVYFVLYIWGKSSAPLNFTYDVEVPSNFSGPTTDISISGIHVFDKINRKVPQYTEFLKQFPDWADLTAWIGAYYAWVI